MDVMVRSSKFPPSDKTPSTWRNSTSNNLQVALRAQQEGWEQFESSRHARDYTNKDNIDDYQNVNANFGRKVDTTRRLAQLLQERIASVTQSMNLSEQSWAALHTAHQAKMGPLQLCIWRQEQRNSRPQRELVRDACEIALEEERDILIHGQELLQQHVDKSERVLDALKKELQDLQQDLENKKHALQIDSKCMAATHQAWSMRSRSPCHITLDPGSIRSPQPFATNRPLPSWHSMLPSSHIDFRDTGLAKGSTERNLNAEHARHEAKREEDTVHLCQRAKEIEHAALKLRRESNVCIEKAASKAKHALNQVERTLLKRISETKALCQKLDQGLAQTNVSISQVSQCNSLTHNMLEVHRDPSDLLASRSKWREQRTPRENIGDPVTSSMEKQRTKLRVNRQHLQDVGHAEINTVQELKRSKALLEEDIRDKLAALQIDMRCREQTQYEPKLVYDAKPTPPRFGSSTKSDKVPSRPRSATSWSTVSSRPRSARS